MKVNALKYFVIFLMILFLSCDHAEHKFKFINKTGKNLAIYLPKILPVDNKLIYNAFKPKKSANSDVPTGTHISLNFKVEPYAKKENFSMYSFASQFKTSDGKLHLIILDVDSLKSMAIQHTLDSNSIRNAILKHLIISREELEKANKVIIYEN